MEIDGSQANATKANVDQYEPFFVTTPIVVDLARFDVFTGPASTSTLYVGLYAADADMQPTGSPLVNETISIGTSATGVFTKQFTPVTVQPGAYVAVFNTSVIVASARVMRGGPSFVQAGGGVTNIQYYVSRTAAAYTSSPTKWNTRSDGTTGFFHWITFRWKAA
jgi:hypothetical protein